MSEFKLCRTATGHMTTLLVLLLVSVRIFRSFCFILHSWRESDKCDGESRNKRELPEVNSCPSQTQFIPSLDTSFRQKVNGMATFSSLFSLDNTLGVFFLAGIFSTCLWGMGCIQLYYYYENSRVDKDKRWIKPYTSAIWILDTLHQGFFIESMYKYFISNYGNILYLVHIDKVIIYMGMGAAVIDAMVQCVFVLRAWKLSNENRILTGALIIAVLGQLGVTLAYAGQAAGFRYVPQLSATVRTERAMNAVWVITDTFIAVVLVYILWKRGLGLKRTDSVLNRLILYSVGTGLVTGVVGVAAFIGSELLPESLIYMFSDLILPKLYLNCLLASLNARVGLRKRLEGDAGCTSIHFTDPPAIEASHPVMAENSQVGSLPSPRAIEYQIDIDIDTDIHPEPGQQRRNSVYTETDPTEIGTRDSESRSLEQ